MLVPGRSSRSFSIAHLTGRIDSNLEPPFSFELPLSFAAFETFAERPGLRVVLSSERRLSEILKTPVGSGGLHWHVRKFEGTTLVELTHPPTARLFCRARAEDGYRHWSVQFEEETVRALSLEAAGSVTLPHPLDQLLWILPLARGGGVFQHASAAVVDGRALVFLGHSGDGKTTLARLLEQEGLPILSDERIAIRQNADAYRVFGTPWSGEGGMASRESRPLSALFLLRKAERHRVREGPRHALAGEMMARSIVPYSLPDVAESVLTTLGEIASRFPLCWLDVARRPGILSVLREFG